MPDAPRYCVFKIEAIFANGQLAFSKLIQAIHWREVTYELEREIMRLDDPWRFDPGLKMEITLVK